MRHRTTKHDGSVLADDHDPVFSARLEGAIANEPDAIRELVEEFGPGLTRYARRKGVADPEGMANATLFGALQNLDTFRGRDRGTFRSYLYRILRRRVIDEVRYASSRPRTVPDLGSEFSGRLIDQTSSSFDEQVVNEDYVDALLTKLTVEQRQILEMRLINDLSIQETADRTGRSITAVKALQRRALLSLRVAAAAMLVLALFFGLRLLLGAGQQSIVVENGPADSPTQSSDESDQGLDGTGGEDSEEVSLPSPDPADADSDAAEVELSAAETEASETQPIIEGASSVSVVSETTEVTPTTAAPDVTAPITEPPAPEPADPASPCTVTTDGSPSVGEIAVVTYNFSGPFSLLRGASAHMIGRSGGSAMLSGFGSSENVGNGRKMPFEVTPNMFNDDKRFVPRAAFGGDDIKTNCEVGSPISKAPCVVTTDGSPRVGEEATITYTLSGVFRALLNERWSYVIGNEGESAMSSGGRTRQVLDGGEHTFTLDGSMWRQGQLDIRSSFRSGEGFISCHVAES